MLQGGKVRGRRERGRRSQEGGGKEEGLVLQVSRGRLEVSMALARWGRREEEKELLSSVWPSPSPSPFPSPSSSPSSSTFVCSSISSPGILFLALSSSSFISSPSFSPSLTLCATCLCNVVGGRYLLACM